MPVCPMKTASQQPEDEGSTALNRELFSQFLLRGSLYTRRKFTVSSILGQKRTFKGDIVVDNKQKPK